MINAIIQVLTPTQVGNLDTHVYLPMTLQPFEIKINGVDNTVPIDFTVPYSVQIEKEITITIDKRGYYPITQTLNLFLDNEYLPIHLILDTQDLNNEYYNAPYCVSKTVQNPCTFDLTNYNMSSFPGERTVYLNGVDSGTGHVVTIPNIIQADVQIGEKGITYNNSGQVEFAAYVTDGNTISYLSNTRVGYNPYLAISDDDYFNNNTTTNFSLTDNTFDLLFDLEEEECYVIGQTVSITPIVSGNFDSQNLSWVIKVNGDIVDEQVLTSNDIYDLLIVELGVYSVELTISNDSCSETYLLPLESCLTIEVTQVGCSDFIIKNKGDYDSTFTLKDSEMTEIKSSTPLPSFSELQLTLDSVDVFYLTFSFDEKDDEIYVINNYCEIEKCMANYTESLLCEPIDRCSPCPDESMLNQMLLLQYTFFMKAHYLLTFNNFYTGFDQTLLDQVASIKRIVDKLKTLCDRECLESTFKEFYCGEPYLTQDTECKTCNQ